MAEMSESLEDLVDSTGNSVLDSLLHYGLFLGAVFQMICIFAVIVVPSKDAEWDREDDESEEPLTADIKPFPSRQSADSHSKSSRRQEKKKKR